MSAATPRPFREIEPYENHAVLGLSFNPTGGSFVVATASPIASVFDREGRLQVRTVRGDMYLHDPNLHPNPNPNP